MQNLDKKMKWEFLLIKNSIQNEHGYLWWCKYEKLNDSIGWLIIEMINNQVSEENEYISWWYILAWQIDESSIERFNYDKYATGWRNKCSLESCLFLKNKNKFSRVNLKKKKSW
jgi:hypothetical protein